MFWNLYKKNLIGPLIQIILENVVDIVALVETDNLDMQGVINALKLQAQEWKVLEICPEADIRVLDNYNFVSNSKIDKYNYSDHLPIKFEIM